jgi:hypothetical protein
MRDQVTTSSGCSATTSCAKQERKTQWRIQIEACSRPHPACRRGKEKALLPPTERFSLPTQPGRQDLVNEKGGPTAALSDLGVLRT